MTDFDDQQLLQVELRGRNEAMNLVKGLLPFKAFAERDELGVMRHGHGRQVEHRPISPSVADVVLKAELVQVADTLRGRIFPLVAVHPQAANKVGTLYALADIVGAETMRDWAPLWEALRKADYRGAASELLNCNWDKYYGSTPDKRRKILDLVWRMGDPPEATLQ
jgi:hypothetical protein